MGEKFDCGLIIDGVLERVERAILLECVAARVEALIGRPHSAEIGAWTRDHFQQLEWDGDIASLPDLSDANPVLILSTRRDEKTTGLLIVERGPYVTVVSVSIPGIVVRDHDLGFTEHLMEQLFHCTPRRALLIGGFEHEIEVKDQRFEAALADNLRDTDLVIGAIGPAETLFDSAEFDVLRSNATATVARHRHALERFLADELGR